MQAQWRVNHCSKEKRKGEKGKAKKNSKIVKPKDVGYFLFQKLLKSQNFDFSAWLSQIVTKRDTSGKNGKLLCCKCIFDRIKANLAKIQPENCRNVQKTCVLQKAPGVNGLKVKTKIQAFTD